MKKLHLLAPALFVGLSAAALTLEEGFDAPPNSAKPHTWYHMMNGNVTKEGITCDFEALARAGIGGVQMFDAGCAIPPGPLAFNSPEWFDMFRHAAAEARRLGLEICIPNCSGWSSSGGPWNMPSNGMKRVVFTETPVKGGTRFSGRLPRTDKDNGFYEDIAVLAFPTPPADAATFPGVKTSLGGASFTLSASEPFTAQGVSFRLDYPWCWSGAANVTVEVSRDGTAFEPFETFVATLGQSGACDKSLRYHPFPRAATARAIRLSFKSALSLKVVEAHPEAKCRISDIAAKTFEIRSSIRRDTGEAQPGQRIDKDRIVDLTSRMAADGSLEWDAPAGDWTLLRIGHVCNGRCNHPASDHGRGLEVDKLSAAAMDYHFDQYVTRLCRHLGPLAGDVESGFNNILVDSYEVGSQNWTQGLDRTFEARMGYSLRLYLPVFTGRVVGSVDESERFLEDFRRVVADLFAENYAGRLAQLCHRHGLKLSLEPYGNAPSDNLQYGQDVDIPMGEFWSNAGATEHATGTGNAKFAAYLAHVWGRRFAATESFTASPNGGGRWQTTPFAIKAQGDRVFAQGVNRIIYHRFTHQPWPGNRYLPGMTMGRWGMHLDRTQTWWEHAGEWFRYQARCQWMLQEGLFVADALFFCGEQAPNQGGNTDGGVVNEMKLPAGYDWDICATKAMHLLKVADGRVVAPGGVRYALLVLPPQDTMSETMLRTVERLLDAGAKVCGLKRPTRAPGLAGYPAADDRVRALAARVWAKGVMTCRPAEALAKLGLSPDFTSTETDARTGAVYIHRRDATADWYFVALNNEHAKSFEASFRQAGRVPEIWDAVTGRRADAPVWREEEGRTVVTLDFPPSGSAFVLFRRPASGDHVAKMSVQARRRQDPVLPEPPHTLVIEKALDGVFAEKRRPDCADVRPYVRPGRTVCASNDALGGDPAPNKVKRLEVVCRVGGETKTLSAPENGRLTVPAGAEIVSAWYGIVDPAWKPGVDQVADITAALAAKVKDGRLSACVDNGLAKRDPAYLQVKEARITYVLDGVRQTVRVPEHREFVLPSNAILPEPSPDWTWHDGRLFAWQPLAATLEMAGGGTRRLAAEPPAPVAVAGAWDVSFPVDWYTGGAAVKRFTWPALKDWTADADPDIRFFSGTAIYARKLAVAWPLPAGARMWLDLGAVKNFAEVTVNGRTFPVLWKPPYRVDVTDALNGPEATLSVRVTNLWPNRLIGDDALPEDVEWKGYERDGVKEIGVKAIPQWVKDGKRSPTGRHTFTTWRHWAKDESLLTSGLLGPVMLRTAVPAE